MHLARRLVLTLIVGMFCAAFASGEAQALVQFAVTRIGGEHEFASRHYLILGADTSREVRGVISALPQRLPHFCDENFIIKCGGIRNKYNKSRIEVIVRFGKKPRTFILPQVHRAYSLYSVPRKNLLTNQPMFLGAAGLCVVEKMIPFLFAGICYWEHINKRGLDVNPCCGRMPVVLDLKVNVNAPLSVRYMKVADQVNSYREPWSLAGNERLSSYGDRFIGPFCCFAGIFCRSGGVSHREPNKADRYQAQYHANPSGNAHLASRLSHVLLGKKIAFVDILVRAIGVPVAVLGFLIGGAGVDRIVGMSRRGAIKRRTAIGIGLCALGILFAFGGAGWVVGIGFLGWWRLPFGGV